MAEEKIINDEIIEDEELEGVAGGASWEIQDDANRLRALGVLGYGRVDKQQVNDAFTGLGLGIGTDLKKGDAKNSYYINHKKVSREKLWNYIYQHRQQF